MGLRADQPLPDVAPKAAGLRAQLIAGVIIISLVSTALVGMLTRWTITKEVEARRQTEAAVLGQTLALTLSRALNNRAALQPLVGRIRHSSELTLIEVLDAKLGQLAVSGSAAPANDTLRHATRSQEQIATLTPDNHVEVCTPMLHKGQLLGVVRIRQPLSAGVASPKLFWLLMGAYGLALIAFITLVLTRYVARPIGAMQRAAARIASGDLDTRLESSGAYEMDSLADSLNQMAGSLQQQRRSLIQSAKLASVGRLAAGVAHEIGNPMQSIIGFADILETQAKKGDAQDREQQLDLVGRIQAEAARIHETLRELLEFARPTRGEVAAVSLGEVVDQALSLLRPQQRFSEIQVTIQPAVAELPPAAANTQQLVQVVVNLLLNAVDAMNISAEGSVGEITIDGEVDPADAKRVVVTIANDGPPISAEDRDKLFEPFFSTKDPGKGSGLGLAVSRSIVESFDGQLVLRDSTPVVFALHLPRML